MKIGLDIDGVFANFAEAYQRLFVKTTGRDWFHVGDAENPPMWHWPTLRGYTGEETKAVWAAIKTDPVFWLNLAPYPDAVATLRQHYAQLQREHDVYFITNREGVRAKQQTEEWLAQFLNTPPTVLLVGHRKKGEAAQALGLDCAIDDYFENVQDLAPLTRTYLLDRTYNQETPDARVRRVDSFHHFLRCENLIPYTEGVVVTKD